APANIPTDTNTATTTESRPKRLESMGTPSQEGRPQDTEVRTRPVESGGMQVGGTSTNCGFYHSSPNNQESDRSAPIRERRSEAAGRNGSAARAPFPRKWESRDARTEMA